MKPTITIVSSETANERRSIKFTLKPFSEWMLEEPDSERCIISIVCRSESIDPSTVRESDLLFVDGAIEGTIWVQEG